MRQVARCILGLLCIVLFYGYALAVQTPLPGSAIPQFVDPLPIPHTIVAGPGQIELRSTEFLSRVLPTTFVPANGLPYAGTWVWGYLEPNQVSPPSYIGPVIVAERGTPTEMKFVNNLGSAATTNVLAYRNSTDQTLHWADPLNNGANMCMMETQPMMPPMGMCAENYLGTIPDVVHLHGGEVPPALDGGPDAWYSSDGTRHGFGYYSKDGATSGNYAIYRYPNSQEAAPIWFHPHPLGVTRLSVYAGLAGAYLVTDPPNDPVNLPPLVPLAIQDRSFDTDGQLYYPAGIPFILNPEHPFWTPEFVGDTIVVNGKTWPYLNVEAKRYRFIFLNGSNARTFEMFLTNPVTKINGPTLWQIGTDGGYLDAPVAIDPNGLLLKRLILMPGERADVIIDFSGQAPGTKLLLRNIAKTPFPNGATPQGSTLGRIMEFRVTAATTPDTSYNPAQGGALRAPMIRLANPATGTLAAGVTVQKTRLLTLNEVMGMPMLVNGFAYPGGPLEILVNNTKWDGTARPDFTPVNAGGHTSYYSETPKEGETEIWEIANLTADAHPIHLHLVQFQLLNRQPFDVGKYTAAYAAAFPTKLYQPGYGPPLDYNTGNLRAVGGNPDVVPFLKTKVQPPAANEAGWKDTVIMYPGQVTRIAVRWAPTDLATNLDPNQLSYPFDPNAWGFGYVWHCHILDHEDNEMMRPTSVVPMAGALRTFVQPMDY
ncbi:MAG: copper oxidase [Desulfuromonadales bacterium GWD2_61_12]|nr:MAG: copper oxidase [Desulfuromonadales bacterium GWD2_61_12]